MEMKIIEQYKMYKYYLPLLENGMINFFNDDNRLKLINFMKNQVFLIENGSDILKKNNIMIEQH